MELYEVSRLHIHSEIDIHPNVKFHEPNIEMGKIPNPNVHELAFFITQIVFENFDHSLEPPL